MGTIYLVRHGQTTLNSQRILQGPRLDAPLSELGLRQAESLANALAGIHLSTVYTSPMRRARETADHVIRAHRARPNRPETAAHPQAHVPLELAPTIEQAPPVLGAAPLADALPLTVVPELYEMDYGALAGRPYEEVRDELEQVLDAWQLGFVDQAFPGGESAVVAQHRIRPFAQRVLQQARRDAVAVVAHGRINRILIATWTGAGLGRLEEFPQSNASLSELRVDDGVVEVVRLNDTSHLPQASEAFS